MGNRKETKEIINFENEKRMCFHLSSKFEFLELLKQSTIKIRIVEFRVDYPN